MKLIATATSNIKFESNGQVVNIVKGDSFSLVGTVFAYHGILIDITQYAGMFSIARHSDATKHLHAMKVVRPFTVIDNHGKEVRLAEGTVIHAVSDIVAVGDCIIDIVKWRDNLVQIDEADCIEHMHADAANPTADSKPADDDSNADGNPADDNPAEQQNANVKKLATPANNKYDNGILLWDAVENADAYDIYINGQHAGEVTATSTDLTSLLTEPGNYLLGVVAKHANADGKYVYSKPADTTATVD